MNVVSTNKHFPRKDVAPLLRDQLVQRIQTLSEVELSLAIDFLEQIVARHDPDVVREFLSYRDDPRIESILQIAASLSEPEREQLLFDAEGRSDPPLRRRAGTD
jgi:hypothetical protein